MKETEKYIRTRVEEEIHRINKTLKSEIAVRITEEVIKASLIETKILEIDDVGSELPIQSHEYRMGKGFALAEFKIASETRKKVVFDASKHLKAALLKDVEDAVEEVLTEQMEKGPILQPKVLLDEKRDKRIDAKIKAGNQQQKTKPS